MMYTSDWHIHSVASYDASLHVADLISQAQKQGLTEFGLADHVNAPSWIHFLEASAALHKQYAQPGFHLGVELTTISSYLEQYDRKHGTQDGFVHPGGDRVDPIAFPLTAEELDACGVEYVIGAEHWLLNAKREQDAVVMEMHRQNLFCACSDLVDIVGHPYCMYGTFMNKTGQQVKFDDFSIVPMSMRKELIAAIKENDKAMEANLSYFASNLPEAFKRDYAGFARLAFESGVRITIGSDCHGPSYVDQNELCQQFLGAVGFKQGDFSSPPFGKRKRSI